MGNKKRIQKLLKRKYSNAFFDCRSVELYDDYTIGYDFAVQIEKIGKAAELAGSKFREFLEGCKKIQFSNVDSEYITCGSVKLEDTASLWLDTCQTNKIKGASPEA